MDGSRRLRELFSVPGVRRGRDPLLVLLQGRLQPATLGTSAGSARPSSARTRICSGVGRARRRARGGGGDGGDGGGGRARSLRPSSPAPPPPPWRCWRNPPRSPPPPPRRNPRPWRRTGRPKTAAPPPTQRRRPPPPWPISCSARRRTPRGARRPRARSRRPRAPGATTTSGRRGIRAGEAERRREGRGGARSSVRLERGRSDIRQRLGDAPRSRRRRAQAAARRRAVDAGRGKARLSAGIAAQPRESFLRAGDLGKGAAACRPAYPAADAGAFRQRDALVDASASMNSLLSNPERLVVQPGPPAGIESDAFAAETPSRVPRRRRRRPRRPGTTRETVRRGLARRELQLRRRRRKARAPRARWPRARETFDDAARERGCRRPEPPPRMISDRAGSRRGARSPTLDIRLSRTSKSGECTSSTSSAERPPRACSTARCAPERRASTRGSLASSSPSSGSCAVRSFMDAENATAVTLLREGTDRPVQVESDALRRASAR